MHIGGSATRQGLSKAQKEAVCRVFVGFLLEHTIRFEQSKRVQDSIIFHHGDCINGDAFLHEAASECNFGIVIHPPENAALRAYKAAPLILPPKPYLERNRDMIDVCETMLICPDTESYRVKSGTWYTWRHAGLQKKRVILITPSGTIS